MWRALLYYYMQCRALSPTHVPLPSNSSAFGSNLALWLVTMCLQKSRREIFVFWPMNAPPCDLVQRRATPELPMSWLSNLSPCRAQLPKCGTCSRDADKKQASPNVKGLLKATEVTKSKASWFRLERKFTFCGSWLRALAMILLFSAVRLQTIDPRENTTMPCFPELWTNSSIS